MSAPKDITETWNINERKQNKYICIQYGNIKKNIKHENQLQGDVNKCTTSLTSNNNLEETVNKYSIWID